MDHNQTKQMLAQTKIRESMANKEMRMTVLQLAIATHEKLATATESGEKATQNVLDTADKYMAWMDKK